MFYLMDGGNTGYISAGALGVVLSSAFGQSDLVEKILRRLNKVCVKDKKKILGFPVPFFANSFIFFSFLRIRRETRQCRWQNSWPTFPSLQACTVASSRAARSIARLIRFQASTG